MQLLGINRNLNLNKKSPVAWIACFKTGTRKY